MLSRLIIFPLCNRASREQLVGARQFRIETLLRREHRIDRRAKRSRFSRHKRFGPRHVSCCRTRSAGRCFEHVVSLGRRTECLRLSLNRC